MSTSAGEADPRIAFWSAFKRWPEDSPTHVFLGRVVQHVGGSVYGERWTGDEPMAQCPPPLPEQLYASLGPTVMLYGCRLLYEHDERYRKRCSEHVEFFQNWPIPTEDEWAGAVTISRGVAQKTSEQFSRFVDVCTRLTRAFRSGSIGTATRDYDGGPEHEEHRSLWYTENALIRFYTCQLDPLEPYKAAIVERGLFLYVDVASLKAALSTEPSTVEAAIEVDTSKYLSPYIRCMIATSRALGISASDGRKKDELIAALPIHWPGAAGELTAADIEHMATFLREPEHKKGRGKKAER